MGIGHKQTLFNALAALPFNDMMDFAAELAQELAKDQVGYKKLLPSEVAAALGKVSANNKPTATRGESST